MMKYLNVYLNIVWVRVNSKTIESWIFLIWDVLSGQSVFLHSVSHKLFVENCWLKFLRFSTPKWRDVALLNYCFCRQCQLSFADGWVSMAKNVATTSWWKETSCKWRAWLNDSILQRKAHWFVWQLSWKLTIRLIFCINFSVLRYVVEISLMIVVLALASLMYHNAIFGEKRTLKEKFTQIFWFSSLIHWTIVIKLE